MPSLPMRVIAGNAARILLVATLPFSLPTAAECLGVEGSSRLPPLTAVALEGPLLLVGGDPRDDRAPGCNVGREYAEPDGTNRWPPEGGFADVRFLGAGNGPYSVAIADLNGDQLLDLTVANALSDDAAVLFGMGDGTFLPASFYRAGDPPLSVAVGDLDNDLVPDLAVADVLSHDVAVLLGVREPSGAKETSGDRALLGPITVAPNPVEYRADVAFRLDDAATIRVIVLDGQGRLVESLLEGPLPAGRHRIAWQPAGGGDAEIPSGVYLVTLRIGGRGVTCRVIVLRR